MFHRNFTSVATVSYLNVKLEALQHLFLRVQRALVGSNAIPDGNKSFVF